MPTKPVQFPPNLRPQRITQVNAFLRQNGIANVELRRHSYYFAFFGPPTYGWMTSSILTDRLDSMTLREWLAKFRELEKLNQGNVLAKAIKSAVKGTKVTKGAPPKGEPPTTGKARRGSRPKPGGGSEAKASGTGGVRTAARRRSGESR